MKKSVFTVAAILGCNVLWTSAVFAADMLQAYEPPVPPLVEETQQFNWDRFYVGVVGGYAIGDVNVTTNFPTTIFDSSNDISGSIPAKVPNAT